MIAEILFENGIESSEIARILKPDAATHDVFRTVSCFGQDR